MSIDAPGSDENALFLLPFEEVPACSLFGEDVKAPSYDNEEIQEIDVESKELFAGCSIQRTGELSLENGDVINEECKEFRLEKGQYLLLRPTENSLRPSVGRAVYFWVQKHGDRRKENYVRVQWLYRAEDLSERPAEAVGEDELFETEHFDDVDIEAIAGRCQVTSYRDWLSSKLAEKEARELASVNEKGSIEFMETRADLNTVEALSDTESSYGDNYASAAVHYYCRRFYDPIKQMFAVSKFEDENADPVEELNLQQGEDEEFEPNGVIPSSDEDVSEEGIDEEDETWHGTRQKRKRSSRRQKGRAERRAAGEAPQKASQFSLPSDAGVPETLPCRDEEKERVSRFLEEAIIESAEGGHGGSRCLYISGVPGTGKTATVREVVRVLSARRAVGDLPPFEAVEVNAMSLPDPNLVYSELYRAITGSQGFSPVHASQLLEKRFADESRAPAKKARKGVGGPTARERGKCVILILDEMDVLVSRKQQVLYDLLEWPTRRNARMALIGIANTMDLPERMLPRLGSRLGVNRLTYPPYTAQQLQTILNLKLSGKRPVKLAPDAIKLCAQKVGAVSGDVRRALEIVRRASELMAEEKRKKRAKKQVTAAHINAAFHDIAGGSRLMALKQLSLFEKLFLVSAVSLARSEGSFSMDVTCSISAVSGKAQDEAKRYSNLFRESGIPSMHELEEACWRLSGQRIVLIEKAAVFRNSRVIVNISADDCSFALSKCELSRKILKLPDEAN